VGEVTRGSATEVRAHLTCLLNIGGQGAATPLNVNNARRHSKLIKKPMPNQNRLTDTVNDAKRKKMLNNLPKKDKTN